MAMKVFVALLVMVCWAGAAVAGNKDDQAKFEDWERMFFDRTMVGGIKEHCPQLAEVGLITTRVPTPPDWSENDQRYDVLFRYEARGVERGEKTIAKLVAERGQSGFCREIWEDYGPEGNVYGEIVVELPRLREDELHVTLGEFSTRMTMAEAEKAFGKEAACYKLDGKFLEYCAFSKGELGFRGRVSGEQVRMMFSRDGQVYELSRSIDLSKHMRDVDALAQVREKFARFGEPHVRGDGASIWRLREGLEVRAYVFEGRLSMAWVDERLKEQNRAAMMDEKRRCDIELQDEAAREKLKL
ncbi:hypothetical protein [Hyphomicrobium zavarzinii]|uniref:hypothetical protein n=1 Tax=Hyphomicrobium zavarzinii TaxID=48292 RepID=UPI00036365F4|nr:hypothetical protein [Hyphomicrobium zavarzinii]